MLRANILFGHILSVFIQVDLNPTYKEVRNLKITINTII